MHLSKILFVLCAAAAIVGIYVKTQCFADSMPQIESRSDRFRLSGAVEFDGERITYDEIIQVRIDVGTTSTMGLKRGDNRLFFSRLQVTRRLKGGGALVMEVPQAAGLFTDLERADEAPDPRWTPDYITAYLRPPPEFLPEFRWVNSIDHPTSIELYYTEAYYAQENTRLRIVSPIHIEFVPPSQEAEMLVMQQMESETPVNISDPNGLEWGALMATEIPFAELAKLPPDVRIQMDKLMSENGVQIPIEPAKRLWTYAHQVMNVMPGLRSERLGVPQPRKYPDGYGRLYRGAIPQTADYGIPIRCSELEKRCVIAGGERGYAVFYRAPYWFGGWTIQVGNAVNPAKPGEGIVDYQHRRIVLIQRIPL